jgi:tetratricopeptide (TPR) repeat protein
MIRFASKPLLLLILTVLFTAESVYFGRHAVAAFRTLSARRAFNGNEFRSAWERYASALGAAEDRASIEQEMLDLLIFGLVQGEAGIDLGILVTPEGSLSLARDLVARRLRDFPSDARAWSKDAELKFYAARQARRETPIDLSRLSEDPVENLLTDEAAAIASLRTAAALEPNNYFYHDLLVSFFLEIGAPDEAARHARRAIAAYPSLEGHAYLNESGVPAEVLDAAIEGLVDRSETRSLIPRPYRVIDAGYLLLRHGEFERAIVFLQQGVAEAPDLFGGRYRLGQALLRAGDYRSAQEHLLKAVELDPSFGSTYYSLGLAHEALGDLPAAIVALTVARRRQPELLGYRHKLGELLEKAGRFEEAERQFVAAVNLRSDDPVALQALMRFHLRRQDRASALEICRRLSALGQKGDVSREQCAALQVGPP